MSSAPPPSERPGNASPYGGNGLYESTRSEQDAPLKVQLSEHLDKATQRSLQSVRGSGNRGLDFMKRNPIPTALALGGIVWLLASLGRRSFRG